MSWKPDMMKSQRLRLTRRGLVMEAIRDYDREGIKYRWMYHPDKATQDGVEDEMLYLSEPSDQDIMEEMERRIDLHMDTLEEQFGKAAEERKACIDKLRNGIEAQVRVVTGMLDMHDHYDGLTDMDLLAICCSLARMSDKMEKFLEKLWAPVMGDIGDRENEEARKRSDDRRD